MSLTQTFTGWHEYEYPQHKYRECSDSTCAKMAPHKNNYYKCPQCQEIVWFESKICTFKSGTVYTNALCVNLHHATPVRASDCAAYVAPLSRHVSDDITRAEGRARIKSGKLIVCCAGVQMLAFARFS